MPGRSRLPPSNTTLGIIPTKFENLAGGKVAVSGPSSSIISVSAGSSTNAGHYSVSSGAGFQLGGNWSNAEGTILVSSAEFAESSLTLWGTFRSADIGTITSTPANRGKVRISGECINTDATISLNASTANWSLSSGTIVGGTIRQTEGAALVCCSSFFQPATLVGPMTFVGDLVGTFGRSVILDNRSGVVDVTGVMAFTDASLIYLGSATVTCRGNQIKLTNGNVVAINDGSSVTPTLTIPSSMRIRGRGTVGATGR
jgi:hypothetical protein